MHRDTHIMSITIFGSSFRRNHYQPPVDSDYMQNLREKVVAVRMGGWWSWIEIQVCSPSQRMSTYALNPEDSNVSGGGPWHKSSRFSPP